MVARLKRMEDDSFAQAGEQLYERLLPRLQNAKLDSFVVMDVESGDFEVDPDHLAAVDRLRARHPEARMWVRQIGRRFVRVFGSHRRMESQ